MPTWTYYYGPVFRKLSRRAAIHRANALRSHLTNFDFFRRVICVDSSSLDWGYCPGHMEGKWRNGEKWEETGKSRNGKGRGDGGIDWYYNYNTVVAHGT